MEEGVEIYVGGIRTQLWKGVEIVVCLDLDLLASLFWEHFCNKKSKFAYMYG